MSRCRSRLTAPQAGGSAALALGGAVAVDGDATGAAGNVSVSDNTTLATNDMTTGDATAINQVQVDVTQNNHNAGRRDLSRSLARTDRGGGAAAPPPRSLSSSLSTWRHPAESRQQHDECESKTSGGGSPSRRSCRRWERSSSSRSAFPRRARRRIPLPTPRPRRPFLPTRPRRLSPPTRPTRRFLPTRRRRLTRRRPRHDGCPDDHGGA